MGPSSSPPAAADGPLPSAGRSSRAQAFRAQAVRAQASRAVMVSSTGTDKIVVTKIESRARVVDRS